MRPEAQRLLSDPFYLLALGFGSGLSPKAPGTAGSVVALALFFLLNETGPLVYSVIVVISLAAGIYFCGRVAQDLGSKDPGVIVWDEFVGMWIALFMVPPGWYWIVVAFVLFRAFDVVKPWPANWCDRELEGGLGIMMDDVVAGAYTLMLVQALAFAISEIM